MRRFQYLVYKNDYFQGNKPRKPSVWESTFAIQEMRDSKHKIYKLFWWDISFKNRTGTALRNPVKSSQSKINVLMEVFIQKLSGIKVFLLILYLINMSGEKNRSRLNTPLLSFLLEHVSVARCVWKVEKKESLSFRDCVTLGKTPCILDSWQLILTPSLCWHIFYNWCTKISLTDLYTHDCILYRCVNP